MTPTVPTVFDLPDHPTRQVVEIFPGALKAPQGTRPLAPRLSIVASATADAIALEVPRQIERQIDGCPGLKQITYRSGRQVWVYRYTCPQTRKRASLVIGDCSALDEIAARIEVRIYLQRIEAGLSPRLTQMTLAAFFDRYYLTWAKDHKRSWRDDESRFDLYVREALGGRILSTVTTRQMERLAEELRQGQRREMKRSFLAEGTVNHVLALFKAIFREAVNADLLDDSPAKRLRLRALNNQRQEVYTEDELALILPALQMVNPLVRLLFVCLLATGARIGELLNAHHDDVNVKACTLQLRQTKSGRALTLPLSAPAMAAYAELQTLAHPDNPHLFPACRGTGPMSPPRKVFQQVLAELGICNRTFHDARRTVISTVVQMPGMSVLDASRLANHASVKTTQKHYVVLSQRRLRQAVDGLGEHLPLQLGLLPVPK